MFFNPLTKHSNILRSAAAFFYLLVTASTLFSQEKNKTIEDRASHFSQLRGSGLMFTQNMGQLVDMQQNLRSDVLFKGSGNGADIYLRKTGVSYVLTNLNEIANTIDIEAEEARNSGKKHEAVSHSMKLQRVDIDFEDCNLNAQIITAEQVEGYNNYYYAHCPDGILNVHSYNEVTAQNIYKNIDVKYYGGKQQGLKYDIVVNPGGNPNDIKIKYSGADNLKVEGSALKVESSLGEITEWMPRVYQNIDGKIVDVKAEYVLNGTTLNFELGTYNSQFPLIIDPWVSYFGGSGRDVGRSVTTDVSGNVIFTGYSLSTDLPVSTGAFQTVFGGFGNAFWGTGDAFVTKMDMQGNLLWSTYYGGTSDDYGGYGITTDAAGNVIVTGNTISTNFPVGASGANTLHQNTYGGCSSCISNGDVFLLKLDAGGQRLFATYYGGSNSDKGLDVTTDGNNIYLYGCTNSPNNISSTGTFQPALKGSNDVFIAKFSATGVRAWATYVGGSFDDNYGGGGGIEYNSVSGNIYFSGTTTSMDFPSLAGFQMTKKVGFDNFLCSFSPAGT